MATTNEVKTGVKGNGNGGTAPSRFTKVVTDRPMYRVDKCAAKPLVGYLLGLAAMPPVQVTDAERAQGKTGAWNAYVIKTTEVTLTCATKDAPATETPAGTEVVLGESVKLEELRKYLYNDKMIEVSISTTGKQNLAGGKTMRTYDIGANFDAPIPRPAQYALPTAVLPPTKALAQANADAEDDIGF
jgi:hypothetical protein